MKKIIALLLVAIMALSLVACGGDTDTTTTTNDDNLGRTDNSDSTTTTASGTEGDNNPGTQGGNQGGNQQGNGTWFTNEQLTALGITGLSSPNATYTIYHYPNSKMGGINFTNGTINAFNDYASVLYNHGFNKSYNDGTYTDLASINDALEGADTYKTFTACKYVAGSYRVEIFGNHIDTAGYKDTSFTINFYDLSTRPEKTWFTSSEVTAMGLTGLDTFENISNKNMVNSNVSTWGNKKMYEMKVSGIAKDDALALIQYFFNKGANISHYDDEQKSTYTDEGLFDDYTDSISYWGQFCTASTDCSVIIDWCEEPYDASGNPLPEDLLGIKLDWNTTHTVGNH